MLSVIFVLLTILLSLGLITIFLCWSVFGSWVQLHEKVYMRVLIAAGLYLAFFIIPVTFLLFFFELW